MLLSAYRINELTRVLKLQGMTLKHTLNCQHECGDICDIAVQIITPGWYDIKTIILWLWGKSYINKVLESGNT